MSDYHAHAAVSKAIQKGILERPTKCEACRRARGLRIQGHHYLGYAKKHWLDVTWLCVSCHKRVEVSLIKNPRLNDYEMRMSIPMRELFVALTQVGSK